MSLDDSDRESQGRLSGNRFEAMSDRAVDSEREVVPVARPRRRLVLLSQNADPIASDHEWDSDTESVEGVSDVEDEECPEASVLETPILAERIQARARAFASPDSVNLPSPSPVDAGCAMGVAWSIPRRNSGDIARDSGRVSFE